MKTRWPRCGQAVAEEQQRITSLYGVAQGRPLAFFEGNAQTFAGLRFHLENELVEFYQPVKMRDDPLWVDVTDLMLCGNNGLGEIITQFAPEKIPTYIGRLSRLLVIADIDIHAEEVTGKDKTLDAVVDIFTCVNSGGTKYMLTRMGATRDWGRGAFLER